MKKAIIAMSGGVDSSVAALLTKESGDECIGATMKLYNNEDIGVHREKTCCSLDDVEDARSVAYQMDMPYYVFNFTADFHTEVMDRFVDAYENGCTPNPCIDCNRYLKFDKMFHRMQEIGYDYIVTGHYARVEYDEKRDRYLLKKAVDDTKDQSYVLYMLTQEQLAHVKLPLGGLRKDQVRVIAEKHGFINARKHDSQDICFVPDGDYAEFIRRESKKEVPEGNFVSTDGKILGRHKGITHYTVGQRKGLGLSLGHPAFVLEIRPETNEVVIGTNEESMTRFVKANRLNFMAVEDIEGEMRAFGKIRYNHKGAPCTVKRTGEDEILCTFDEPVRAVTPGQALVLYDGDYVLGGGTIITDRNTSL